MATRTKSIVDCELAGETCNRDAIGAVVEIDVGDGTLTRSLRAGDGFLSQSSKELHFGLGDATAGASLSAKVRWPGADEPETFSDITPGKRYRLRQGSGAAEEIARASAGNTEPASKPVPTSPRTELARVVLTQRRPAQPIAYVDFDQKVREIGPATSGGGPVLINVWESWCAPCRAELADFAAHHGQLSAKGLKIVALTTEAIRREGYEPSVRDAIAFAGEAALPFELGATDANGIRTLTHLEHSVFARERPLPLPSSFLIDRHGRLAVIYRGPVSAEQLLADIDLLDAAPAAIVEQAFPFRARDGLELFGIGDLDFARAYQEGGYLDDARKWIRSAIDHAEKTENLAGRANAWYHLAMLEQGARQWEESAAAYRKTLEFAPQQALIHVLLGVVLAQDGKKEESQAAFAAAEKAGADNPTMLDALGKANLQIERYGEAIRYLQRAAELQPEELRHQISLAIAEEKSGAPQEAIERYEGVLETHPDSSDAKNNLAWILATSDVPEVRDGARALELANEVNAASGFSKPSTLSTLAAAQAEAGDLAAAKATLDRAIRLARAAGRGGIVNSLRERRAEYRSRKPGGEQ